MPLIDVKNLTFAYDGSYDNIFENVSFRLDSGWRLGLIGRNGRGKTTLLNLLMDKYEYRGEISHNQNFAYFPYFIRDENILAREAVLEINPQSEIWQVERELSLLDVDLAILERPFKTLSNGERVKLMLSALFSSEHDFLLIDEPTNHLDLAGREIVARYLNRKSGYILVSHDRTFLDNCVDHILSINRADISVTKGNFTTWFSAKELQDKSELSENEKLAKDVRRLKEAARRTSGWSDAVEKTKYGSKNSGGKPADRGFIGAKSAKMMKRAKNIERRTGDAIAEKSKLLKNIETAESLKIFPLKYHSNKLVTLDKVSIAYNDNTICRDISLSINSGDRIAIRGKNGSGKSSIIKLICGKDIPFTGSLQIGSGLKISYVPQDTSHLSGSLRDFSIEHGIDETLFKSILRYLDFSRVQFDKDIGDFSAGMKKKVLIAKSLCEQAHLYIWDEPLNYIDLMSRMQIEELLINFKPTMLFVEHDKAFSEIIANKIAEL